MLDWADNTWAQVRAHDGVVGVKCGARVEVTAGAARFLRVRLPQVKAKSQGLHQPNLELDHLSCGSVAQNFRGKKMKRFKKIIG